VFVEVKTRGSEEFGAGAAAVTGSKQRRIGQMAVDFLSRRHLTDQPCRSDVVAVSFVQGQPCVEIYENAFDIT
jgi:putative endonuclease